jgi:hypothetical protein
MIVEAFPCIYIFLYFDERAKVIEKAYSEKDEEAQQLL